AAFTADSWRRSAFIDEVGVGTPAEMVDVLCPPPYPLASRRRLPGQQTQPLLRALPIGVSLVDDLRSFTRRGSFPPGIARYRDAGRAEHLVLRHLQRHVVAGELTVELALRHQRLRLPA